MDPDKSRCAALSIRQSKAQIAASVFTRWYGDYRRVVLSCRIASGWIAQNHLRSPVIDNRGMASQ